MSLAALLLEHPSADDTPLLHTIGETVTAGEARAKTRALAAQLSSRGIRPGHAVAVQMPNGPEVVIAMSAIWLAGAVFVPLNPRHPRAEVDRVVDAVRPTAILRGRDPLLLDGGRTYEGDSAFVLWTSGTTGNPKPVLHTHTAYLELIDRVLAPLRAQPPRKGHDPSPNLIPVSLALNAGIYNVLFGLRAGAPLVIMDRFEASTFATLVRRHGIRSTVAPPAAIAMLNDEPSVTDLSPLKYVRSITAPLSPLQARRFTERFGAFVLNSYGQAEIGEVIGWTAKDAKEHPEKVGAIGRPHAGVDLRFSAEGELLVRPPNMAAGYASGGDLGDRLDPDGFLRTGDIAHLDEDGFVWLDGRLGDLINRGGNKVFPAEVEEVLLLSTSIREVAVVGVPDDRLGEVPVAFFVASGSVDAQALTAHCREHLVPYKVPVAFERVETLPRTEVGKVLRRELVARYASVGGPAVSR